MEESLKRHIENNMSFLFYLSNKYYPTDPSSANDLVQDTVLRMNKSYNKEKFNRSWINSVMRSTYIDNIRRQKYDVSLDDVSEDELSSSMIIESDKKDELEMLFTVLDIALRIMNSPIYRAIVRAELKGKDVDDISREDFRNLKRRTKQKIRREALDEFKRLSIEVAEIFNVDINPEYQIAIFNR